MSPRETLEAQIEQLRLEMYKASQIRDNDDHVIKISQELDVLLNKLDDINEKVNKALT